MRTQFKLGHHFSPSLPMALGTQANRNANDLNFFFLSAHFVIKFTMANGQCHGKVVDSTEIQFFL